MTQEPSPAVAARAAEVLGWTPRSWRPIFGGYTPAARYVAAAGAERAFVKVATTPLTAFLLRREAGVYERLCGPFMPRLIGWDDHEAEPLLIIEDLSDAFWPPAWDAPLVEAVLERLQVLHATESPLPTFTQTHGVLPGGWTTLAENPAPFLSLGLASREWLTHSLPALIEAEAACPLDGPSPVHFDLRSDNICRAADGVKFIDWPGACLGNPELDLGGWLPSLAFEGGPLPEDILPEAPQVAAWVSGYFAANAGLPTIPDAPFVRRVQREQLTTALPWAIRALKLGEP
jgi:hypothetical protein